MVPMQNKFWTNKTTKMRWTYNFPFYRYLMEIKRPIPDSRNVITDITTVWIKVLIENFNIHWCHDTGNVSKYLVTHICKLLLLYSQHQKMYQQSQFISRYTLLLVA